MTTTTQAVKEMTVADIGQTAGAVYRFLERNGDSTLAQIKKGVDAPADLVTMALGWLAREEKLRFVQTGRIKKISLA
jgi:hypothetical protein